VVIPPLTTQHYPMLQRNLIYTAVTRGRRLVVIVGQKKALAIAVKGNRPPKDHPRRATLARPACRGKISRNGTVHGGRWRAGFIAGRGRGCGSASSPSCARSPTRGAASTGTCTGSRARVCGRIAVRRAEKGGGAGPQSRRLREQALSCAASAGAGLPPHRRPSPRTDRF
jgi:hypothetical protein